MICRMWHGVTLRSRADAYTAFLQDRAFAGKDLLAAKYYPEDQNFLLECEPQVQHFTVTTIEMPSDLRRGSIQTLGVAGRRRKRLAKTSTIGERNED